MSAQKKEQPQEQQEFSADVSRLLDIVAHALYTNHDVFLRELISNAADACDRLRYDSIQNPDLIKDNPDFRICVYKDSTARTLTLVDNGVGMDDAELADNLGTIAKSGTAALMEQMEGVEQGADKLKLIGQFGVGFYAGYMIAHKIEVVSRKAGEDTAWLWESDGKSGFTIREANDTEKARLDGARGTAIMLHTKDEACEFLLDEKIKMTVKEYSDHINVPIYLGAPSMVAQDKDAEAINSSSALWMRSKSDITDSEYTDFYRHLSAGMDQEPNMTSHWKAEGAIEFTSLLYTPSQRPWDLLDPTRKHFVKLYVRRVFITDELENLMFPWLRFLRGVIDSEDLPLNISRETLQHNPIIEKIKNAVARKVLGDLDKLSRDDTPAFNGVWEQFAATLKEGLYDAVEHRPALMKICRFYSTHKGGKELTSFADYVDRMKEGQDRIFYLSGESLENIQNSPQLEGFKSRDIEVLFFTDTIDDFWLQSVLDFKGTNFQSITKGDVDIDGFGKDKDTSAETNDNDDEAKDDNTSTFELITALQELLKDKVHNVRKSKRLTDSPVCLVAPEGGVDMYMERVLKVHQNYDAGSKPVLEINPRHPLIESLVEAQKNGDDISDAGFLLFDQAKIIQGEPIDNPTEFVRRMSDVMKKAI